MGGRRPFAGHAGVEEAASVTLRGPAVGEWEFLCRGTGLPPAPAEPTTISTVLGQDGSALVTWRNPTNETAKVASHEHYCMLLELDGCVLAQQIVLHAC